MADHLKNCTRQADAGVTPARRRCHGFTLMEALIASVILSTAVAALSQAVVSGQAHAYDSIHRMRGSALGQALMEEVSALPYPVKAEGDSSYPAKPSSRSAYDSMDDFDGYIEAADSLRDQAGRDYDPPYQIFARKVVVKEKVLAVAPLGNITGMEITVSVIDEHGKIWTLTRFMPQPFVEVTP